ncbi:cytoplasmic dynein 1 intermediate chain 1-like [Amphibalanus amphitrite]|uniref:cytoplasmic dynein 1 intermediate chain 1-like n=1 Tax=Amphibalanus amphitrite TaxID=1232801 RepID=UPI001C903BD5|nr:cytoplasmic dynein 1 intermediate chain 1-like [Amphibalanus amphitrite]XP_043241866.1 cytoplasmic dynein 1 intermediate chain 1-like [Amphibalanus amphitrite]XP_043241867.1 cytoplasmic dynein 1 intermediate chain 1-like [Amphibalanus amphitrite]XP_043241868.1 cytoplasmic dynein 1 intermediate chain 1-like [Amphibalanus amphitrite]XP_043241869.1 cytoplasmic dynein 1 intermediate chain 1-like [Amphibalanus amphitrite]
MSMSDRKAELERKKARLQALRDEKQRRQQEKEQALARQSLSPSVARPGPVDRASLDEELRKQGIAPISDVSDISATPSGGSLQPSEGGGSQPSSLSQPAPAPTAARKKPPDLTVVQVHSTSIPPKESVTYCKQTQTTASGPEQTARPGGFDYYVLTYDEPHGDELEDASLTGLEGRRLPPGILHHGMPTVTDVQPATVQPDAAEKPPAEPKKPEPRELSEEQKQLIMMSAEFSEFFSRQSRVVERVLCEDRDLYSDYSRNFDDDGMMDDKSGQQLSVNRVFFDERWSQHRTVTSLDWSPQFPELLAASYNNNESAPHEPDGVCLVWNTRFKKDTPEYIFHCQSPLMSVSFARFHPNLLLGGTYSGQIVLWDNRVQRRTPVQRSPLSTAAHTHPVYCMRVVGTQNAHNLISVSTDGKLCSWSLDMLSQPQEKMELQFKQSRPVPVTGLAFPQGEVNNFVVASEDGNLYTACRHGSRAGVQEVYQGHCGPVTGVSAHAASGPLDFSHLFISSSIDWTVKLWSVKEPKPLYSFEDNSDYVYDAAWSPLHPALFAAVDGTGRLDVWNLNAETEVPVAGTVVDGGVAALNRVSWTPSGLHITVGDDRGRVWVYDVGERLAHPRQDEWTRLAHTLQEMRSNNADEELDRIGAGTPSR